MIRIRPITLAGMAALVLATGSAKADYTTTLDGGQASPVSFGNSSSIDFQTQMGGTPLVGPAQIDLLNFEDTTSQPDFASTDKGTVVVNFTLTVTNAGGTGSLDLTDTITFSRNDDNGQDSTEVLSGLMPLTVGAITYTFSDVTYSGPTPNSGSHDGALGVTITPSSAVPEPASMTLMGLGLVGAGVIARRKRNRASA